MSRNLVVHYKRVTYLIEPNAETKLLAGAKRGVEVLEDADGRVEIRHEGCSLPYSIYDNQPLVNAGEVVENKRLGAALAFIQCDQARRDSARLGSPKITLRQKERIRIARAAAEAPDKRDGRVMDNSGPLGHGTDRDAVMTEFFDRFRAEQKAKTKRQNDASKERRRARELAAALARGQQQQPANAERPPDSGTARLP